MRRRLLDWLRCPACRTSLVLESFLEAGDHILEGLLKCGNGCSFPIRGGVPRMIPEGREDRLQRATATSFGHEWSEYDRFGWSAADLEAEVEEIEVAEYAAVRREDELAHTIPTFRRKTLLAEGDLEGRLVLDVGCGNGRYCFVARRFGAEVIGIDLSSAVDAAFANTRDLDGVHVVQADVFEAPFADETFSVVFSIGVLHHTPSAEEATRALPRLLRPEGLLSVHLYRRQNPVYEVLDRGIRAITTRLPLSWCWRLCHLPTVVGKLFFRSRLLFAGANALVTVHVTHHHNFDWYSAPVASHHTESEVIAWLREAGLHEVVSDDPTHRGDSYFARIYPSWARRPDGTVKAWVHALCPHWALTVRGRRPPAA